jgi:Fe-S cluster biogenesis protein NfuA
MDQTPDPDPDPNAVVTRLERFMRRNFPQIELHGGSAGIEGYDPDTGEVWLSLGGACSGCGISPMTVQALRTRMVSEFEAVHEVHASTGGGFDARERPDLSDVPF